MRRLSIFLDNSSVRRPPIMCSQIAADRFRAVLDRNPAVASAYGIQSVPTLMVFREGAVMFRQSGVMQANQIKSVLDGILQQHG